MYGRKIKVSKKKVKGSGLKSHDGGSNWGPRVAIEQAAAASQLQLQQNLQKQKVQQLLHQNHGSSSSTSAYSKSQDYGSSGGSNRATSSSNNSQYQSSHPSSSRSSNNNDLRPSTSNVTGIKGNGKDNGSYHGVIPQPAHPRSQKTQQQQQQAMNSKSSNDNGNKHGKALTDLDNLNKPLSVIIPPPDRFNMGPESFGPDRDSSLPSTKTWRSSPDAHDLEDNDMPPNTGHHHNHHRIREMSPPPEVSQYYHLSQKKVLVDYEQHQQRHHGEGKSYPPPPPPPPPPSSKPHLKSNDKKPGDYAGKNGKVVDHSERIYSADDEFIPRSSKTTGSTITALAQGLAMVYVPMESANHGAKAGSSNNGGYDKIARSGSKTPEQQALEKLDNIIDGAMNASDMKVPIPGPRHNISRQGLNAPPPPPPPLPSVATTANNNKANTSDNENKDPDGDSLLESFDSIIFKPKSIIVNGKSKGGNTSDDNSGISSNSSPDIPPKIGATYNGSRLKQQISESPPPLPPSNLSQSKGKKVDKNLRFSEQVEKFHSASYDMDETKTKSKTKSPAPPPPIPSSSNSVLKHSSVLKSSISSGSSPPTDLPLPSKLKKRSASTIPKSEMSTLDPQQDTQSISTEVVDLQRHADTLLHHRDESHTNFHNTILSCGHVRTSSNYSTLSSIASSLTGDEDENGGERIRDTRSALEQLRDLSLLIGGNFHSANNHTSNNNNSKGKHKHSSSSNTYGDMKIHGTNPKESGNKSRKDSEGHNSSGTDDSGKGSGSAGQSPTEDDSSPQAKNSSHENPSCAFTTNRLDCEDCFMVFKNPLATTPSNNTATVNSSADGHHPNGTVQIPQQHPTVNGKPNKNDHHLQAQINNQRCENHHHLIIQDQSRLSKLQSIVKTRTSSSGSINSSFLLGSSSKFRNSLSSSSSSNKKSSKKSKKSKKCNDLVLEYCDCSTCDCKARRKSQPKGLQQEIVDAEASKNGHILSVSTSTSPSSSSSSTSPPDRIINNSKSSNVHNRRNNNLILQTTALGGSSSASPLSSASGGSSGGEMHNQNGHHHNNNQHPSTLPQLLPPTTTTNTIVIGQNNNNSLFTIDEEDIDASGNGSSNGDSNGSSTTTTNQTTSTFMDVTIKEFNQEEGSHKHPTCWLSPDPTMGWSDLESLYSQNLKMDTPININDECWTCWKDLTENHRNNADSNRTVDRTKRMFIWLNRRHKEFNAPWWEAKKQASIRWLVTKSFAHLPKEAIGDAFKESKKGKPKYRLKEDVIKGLVNGKLYCLALDNLYNNQQYRSRGLTHWDIINILSRRGVYVAQPSDMKLTEGTLRQKKPLKIAAHVALIEAIMGLYCKEILNRDRIVATLNSFGHSIDAESANAEELLIAWINAAMLSIKSFILTNKNQKLSSGPINVQR